MRVWRPPFPAVDYGEALELLDEAAGQAHSRAFSAATQEGELLQHERLACLRRLMKWGPLGDAALEASAGPNELLLSEE